MKVISTPKIRSCTCAVSLKHAPQHNYHDDKQLEKYLIYSDNLFM